MWCQSYGNETASRIPPTSATDALGQCDKYFYPNIFFLLNIFASLPITTNTSDRSFPTLRRIKTYLRNAIGRDWLNGLTLLIIHRKTKVSPKHFLGELKKPRILGLAMLCYSYIYGMIFVT